MDANITSFVLVFVRIMSMLACDVIFGSALVPFKFRLLLAMVMSFCVTPFLTTHMTTSLLSFTSFTLIITQVLIGVLSAAVFQIIFQIALLAGQFIATQSGLGSALLIDPNTETGVNVLSEFYYITAILLFISLNGHLMVLQFMINSFDAVALNTTSVFTLNVPEWLKLTNVMFTGGLSIALPTITALFITNLSFGVMTRSAPQLNIFNVGLSVMMLVALTTMFITFSGTLAVMHQQFDNGFNTLKTLFEGLSS